MPDKREKQTIIERLEKINPELLYGGGRTKKIEKSPEKKEKETKKRGRKKKEDKPDEQQKTTKKRGRKKKEDVIFLIPKKIFC